MWRPIRKLTQLSVLLLLAGCAAKPSFVAPQADFNIYQSIAVLPLADQFHRPGVSIQIADSLYQKLQTSSVELVDWMSTLEVLEQEAWRPELQSNTRAVVRLGERLQTRAVLTGSIDEWRNKLISTNPSLTRTGTASHNYVSIVGITLRLIDCRCGHIVWSASKRGSANGRDQHGAAASKTIDQLLDSLVDYL
ncbi:MAG: hypothetical protein JSW54_05770 [Fidelibacterota bacterium]|nr:MAG: hypothetical protein JSW54_05770 [Candidatus Neomarinimicrobiota bacterium]